MIGFASRPARARGLKLALMMAPRLGSGVAPRAGAWIETEIHPIFHPDYLGSRPARARGLKHAIEILRAGEIVSRPARARGLKPYSGSDTGITLGGRAPRGRVD